MIPDRIRTLDDFQALLSSTTNYEEKMPLLRGNTAAERAFDLDRMRGLLEALDHPEIGPVTVHVTGSKGKGSTCRMVDAVLRAAGRGPVGLYVSPHLERLTERVSVDGVPIEDDELARAADALLPWLRRTHGTTAFPTFFEILTGAAHVAFRARGVRSLVLEVGLGGRLDATTVCRPTVTAITTVELEHTKLLGDTLEKIAFEKAGILKPGVPCVTGVPLGSPAFPVVEEVARTAGAALYALDREIEVGGVKALAGPRLELDVRGLSGVVRGPSGVVRGPVGAGPRGEDPLALTLPVAGSHQARNAAVAVGLARLLHVPDENIVRGLARVTLPARMEQVLASPAVVIDAAHTPASASAAQRTLEECFAGRRVHLVVGMLEEKDVGGVLAPLLTSAASVVATRVASPRALPVDRLAAAVRALSPEVPLEEAGDAATGLARAIARAAREDVILVTGSTYLAGEARTAARAYSGFLPRDDRFSGTLHDATSDRDPKRRQ